MSKILEDVDPPMFDFTQWLMLGVEEAHSMEMRNKRYFRLNNLIFEEE